MSGFGGIVCADGDRKPGDAEHSYIEKMARKLPFQAEGNAQVSLQGSACFCFTLLRTGPAPKAGTQPVTLDEQTWLIGDVRLDGRDDLISRLQADGEECNSASTDEELVLRAWQLWSESGSRERFYRVLEGDFSFALWQPKERRLFCFRDLMGPRAFFYARRGETLCFSNTLEALCQVPWISRELDYYFLGDYLLNGWSCYPDRSVYNEIKRLAPGHMLTFMGDGLKIERFAKLPIEEPLQYKKDEEYIDQYRALVMQAVKERLPKEGAVVFMSGGLDSTMVAATAVGVTKEADFPGSIHACTADYQPLFDDRESEWASVAAKHMGVDLLALHGGEYLPFSGWHTLGISPAEPRHEPHLAFYVDQYRQASKYARVTFTGNGGDDILRGNAWPYVVRLLQHLRIGELALSFGSHFLRTRRMPPIRAGIRTRLRRWFSTRGSEVEGPYPVWLDPEFERGYGLRERWQQLREKSSEEHPLHPDAYALLCGSFWPSILEGDEASRCEAAVETRSPLLDTRLIRFLLRVPPVPWCLEKRLLRDAARGMIPESIRTRPKCPLQEDPVQVLIAKGKWQPLPPAPLTAELRSMVREEQWVAQLGDAAGRAAWINYHPLSMELWLKSR